jgi:hypothetical protein
MRQRMGRRLATWGSSRSRSAKIGTCARARTLVHELLEHRDRSSDGSRQDRRAPPARTRNAITGLSLVYLGSAVVGWQARAGLELASDSQRVRAPTINVPEGGHGRRDLPRLWVRVRRRGCAPYLAIGFSSPPRQRDGLERRVTPLYGAARNKRRALAEYQWVACARHYNPKPERRVSRARRSAAARAVSGICFRSPLAWCSASREQ